MATSSYEKMSAIIWIAIFAAIVAAAILLNVTKVPAARAGIYTFDLVCSEPVVETPILLFVDASGRARKPTVLGEVPGALFDCSLILPDDMVAGKGHFELEKPLEDLAGNLRSVIENPELLIVIPKSLPHIYHLNAEGDWVELE